MTDTPTPPPHGITIETPMAFPSRWLPLLLSKIAQLLGYEPALVIQQVAQYRSGEHYAALRLDSVTDGETVYLSACADSLDELAFKVRDDVAAILKQREFNEAAGRG